LLAARQRPGKLALALAQPGKEREDEVERVGPALSIRAAASPWAKLTTRITPKISVRPTAIKL
jgi:hypothetical protein